MHLHVVLHGRPLFCPAPQTTGTGTRTPRLALGEMGARAPLPRPRRKTHRCGGAIAGIAVCCFYHMCLKTAVWESAVNKDETRLDRGLATSTRRGIIAAMGWREERLDDEAKCHCDGDGQKTSRHVEKRILLLSFGRWIRCGRRMEHSPAQQQPRAPRSWWRQRQSNWMAQAWCRCRRQRTAPKETSIGDGRV